MMGVYIRIRLGLVDFALNFSKTGISSAINEKNITGEYPKSLMGNVYRTVSLMGNSVDVSLSKTDIIILIVFYCLGTILTISYFLMYLFLSTTCKIL